MCTGLFLALLRSRLRSLLGSFLRRFCGGRRHDRSGRRGFRRERRGRRSDAGNDWRNLFFLFFLFFANSPSWSLLAEYFVFFFFGIHIVFVLQVIFLFIIEVFVAAVFIIVVP